MDFLCDAAAYVNKMDILCEAARYDMEHRRILKDANRGIDSSINYIVELTTILKTAMKNKDERLIAEARNNLERAYSLLSQYDNICESF